MTTFEQAWRDGARIVENGVVWIIVGVSWGGPTRLVSRVREGSIAHRVWLERTGR